MGIAGPIITTLIALYECEAMKDFSSVLELGAQRVKDAIAPWADANPRNFYRQLGFTTYDCIDASPAGTIQHDLNRYIEPDRHYDLVTNFGTGEHVLDQRNVFRTVHSFCRVGGLMFHALPCLGWRNHGLFLYQPQLFPALAVANGYDLEHLETWHHSSLTGDLVLVVLRKKADEPFQVPYDPVYIKTCQVRGYERQRASADTNA